MVSGRATRTGGADLAQDLGPVVCDCLRKCEEVLQLPLRRGLGFGDQWAYTSEEFGEEPAAIALAWLLHQKGVTAPIVGPRTLEQLEGASLRATEIELDDAALKALDDIFPGPGGTAPEAYAW